MTLHRRSFVQMLGAGAATMLFAPTIERALAIEPQRKQGTIEDVEHIVILMQENRSFDHYFGTLRGVRGFADPRAVRLPSGAPVWRQPNGASSVAPFHPTAPDLGLVFLEDLPHGWTDTHDAWNGGRYDRWIPAKGTTTMAYLERADIPFHYALADAFTICDAYFCSFMGATDPNRYHMWTGWVGNDGKGGGPVLDNAEAGYGWTTFPERLTQAGITWNVYQDAGAGLDADHYWGWGDDAYIGNYGDNSLLYFQQYQNAAPGSALFAGARSATDIKRGGTLFDQLRADVEGGRLPHVSWIVAPEAYSEHPNWPANYGAWYVAQCLDILTSRPEVWSKTALFITYDENDGFFDHVVPPTPPMSRAQGWSTVETTNELFAGSAKYAAGPYGLGVRVPMLVVSPWSRGGWVCSEVFDHTSLIRFIEARFARRQPRLVEPNITPWRRAVAGDLTSAFDFRVHAAGAARLPSVEAWAPPDRERHPDYKPVAPADGAAPAQEPGVRLARALPYELHAVGEINPAEGTFRLQLESSGRAAAVFQVRAGDGKDGPWTFTVGSGESGWQTWPIGRAPYDFAVHGPNGFHRRFAGALDGANLRTRVVYERERLCVQLELTNRARHAARFHVTNAYTGETFARVVEPGQTATRDWPLWVSGGWYDFVVRADGDDAFAQRVAGHLETGFDSVSDPALGGARPHDRA